MLGHPEHTPGHAETERSEAAKLLTATDRDDKLLDYHRAERWQMRHRDVYPEIFDDNRRFVEQQVARLAHTDLASFEETAPGEASTLEASANKINTTLEQLLARLAKQSSGQEKYFEALDVSMQSSSLRIALRGIGWSVSRDFFSQVEDVGEYYFGVRNRAADIFNQSVEARKESLGEAIPLDVFQTILAQTELTADSIVESSAAIISQVTEAIRKHFPDHQDQQTLAKMMTFDILNALRESDGVSPQDKAKLTLLSLPLRFDSWIRHKDYTAANQNYTGSGIENITVADGLLALDQFAPLELAAGVMKQHKFAELIADTSNRPEASEVFLAEISQIYESRRKISEIMEAALGGNELMLPAEAMSIVSELTHFMENQDLGEVMRLVALLEDREFDLFHVPPNTASFNTIIGNQRLKSAWADNRFGDTFFGGGLYFWGAQQEHWLKGGDESFHIRMPGRELFLVRNKYNNTSKSHGYLSYKPDDYLHPQKKFNIIAMLPAYGLRMLAHQELINKPLNNEAYSSGQIETVTDYQIEEAPMLWRCDKHYGQYDTDYLISPTKEAHIRKYAGDGIRIDRGVTTVGFIGGEYDRLVLPRSISPLKASSLAYTLRIPEVVYEDKLDELRATETKRRESLLSFYAQSVEGWQPEGPETARYLYERLDAIPGLTAKDKLLVRFFFKERSKSSEALFAEKARLVEALGGDWPKQTDLEAYIPKPEYFLRDSTIHGTPHIMRVFLNAEFLGRLAARDTETLSDYQFDQTALRVAVMLHDTRRVTDSAADYKHGQRAAEFSDGLTELDGVDRDKAKRIMFNHSLDDFEEMLPEEQIMKDADALDRFRFRQGPDWRFIRTPFAEKIQQSALHMAELSRFFLDNGYKRSDAVVKAAVALELVEPKSGTDLWADIDALLAQADQEISAIEQLPQVSDNHPHLELLQQADSLLGEADAVIEQFGDRIRSLTYEEKRELVKTTSNELELRILITSVEQGDATESGKIRSFACLKAKTPETIRLLYQHASMFEKSLIATNTSTPEDILTDLAESGEDEIISRVINNPATPKHVIVRWSQSQ